MSWREESVTIRGTRIRVMRGGFGAPLLFLHGAGGAGTWLPYMDALAESYDVIAPEHPGFGASDTPEWLDSVGDLAYFYLDFIRHFGLDGVHLVGHSLGGWIAMELAVRDCHALSSLTLVAPLGIRVNGVKRVDIFLLMPDELIRCLFHDEKHIAVALARQPTPDEIDMQIKNAATLARLAWEPRLFNPQLPKWMHRICVPTLILWGAQDRLVPPAYGPALAALIPGARLQTIGNCGHLPNIEQPEAFVSRLKAFIGGIGA
jgi:pimeloyl-ACP methyl ester carboxylesterase